eukprot:CAMPEP_0168542160 /NCGR_PEP_ID=MMETSP0413-20121227/1200_1 /TAXON_ID=136452 /ORGANISM="Filamoeba nolandi, Strain NC-AS-23-1" /LENGTH=153 /DNA_ID=CAMNT_0008572019 /DNA_START=571 /DNA_END=1032 /DNA_ORIENTATION=+
MTSLPFAYIFPGDINDVGVFMNVLFLLLVLGLGITMTIEGFKVLKLVKELYPAGNSPNNSSQALHAVTKLIVGSSCSLIVTAVVLAITSLIFLFPTGEYRSDNCMAVLVAYRVLELGIMTLIALPLKTYQDNNSSSSKSPGSRFPSGAVSVVE